MKYFTPLVNLLKSQWTGTLFSFYVIKLIIFGSNLSDSLIIIGFLALLAFKEHLKATKAIDPSIAIIDDLQRVKDKVSMLTLGGTYKK